MDEQPTHSRNRPPNLGTYACMGPEGADEIMVIPDTPDRVCSQHRIIRGASKSTASGSVNLNSVNRGIFDRRSQICGGSTHNRGVHSHRWGTADSAESWGDVGSVPASNFKNAVSSTMVEGNNEKHTGRRHYNNQYVVDGKYLHSKSLGISHHTRRDGLVLAESSKPAEEASGIESTRERHLHSNNSIPLRTGRCSSESSRNDSKGKMKIDMDKPRHCNTDDVAGQVAVNHREASSMPQCGRLSGNIARKRLVRNGCISPHNIAKAKDLAESSVNGSADVKSNAVSGGSNPVIDVDGATADKNATSRAKGKGVVVHSNSPRGCENRKDYAGCVVKLQGRSPVTDRVIGKDNSNSSETLLAKHPLSYGSSASEPVLKSNEGQFCAPSTSCKRQRRHDSALCMLEKSPEVICLTSGGESLNRESTMGHAHQRVMDSPVGVIELSPEARESEFQTEARELQLQADEMLARELQEQLYNEMPEASEERGSQLSLRLQLDNLQHASSSGSHLRHTTRLVRAASNPRRPSQSQSLRNRFRDLRRGTRAQIPYTRAARARSRIHRPSSGERNLLFPSNMDLDMRIDLLEALEEVVNDDIRMVSQLLDSDREFDENDYEMLLALDENNHEHLGASVVQIDNLPVSTVHNDNSEACSICLETPVIGDTIRHLPCLHKFHKDCIDPWLRRKRSCPVCKSDI